MQNQFVVQIYKTSLATQRQLTLRCDGPFTCPHKANDYGLREASKVFGYYNVLPLSPPIPQG